MTKKVDTWMPLLVDKYLGDTTHLTTELHGAYMLLLMSMWKMDGVLPNDDAQLQPITRLSAAKWRAARPVLMAFLKPTEDGAGLTQKRLFAELQRSKASTEKKAGAGSKGAAARWQRDGNANGEPDGNRNGTGDGKRMANGKQEAWETGASTPPPSANADTETASAVSARGAVGMALKRAGLDLTRVNTADPRLTALIDQGATPAEFEGIAREAVEKRIAQPLGWICTTLKGRRDDAAATTLAPPARQSATERRIATIDALTGKDRSHGNRPRAGEVVDVDARPVD